jgi:hypothetical protein
VNLLVEIKAVLFDLHGTLAYVQNPVSGEEISNHLFSRGYEVSPQQLNAAWAFVSFIDYPKDGYNNWLSFFSRIFWRLETEIDEETLDELLNFLKASRTNCIQMQLRRL